MTRRWTTRPVRTVEAASKVSDITRAECAAFGLVPVRGSDASLEPAPIDQARTTARDLARDILDQTEARVVLITGPSGSGKSTLLNGLRRVHGRHARIVDTECGPCDPELSVFDTVLAATDRVGTDRSRTPGRKGVVDALSSAGLAEPALWARASGVLSVGESARLRLACAMVRAMPVEGGAGDPRSVILCDEFASNLDRASAGALAHTAARWARRTGVRFVAATAHEDMPALLTPDLIIDAETMTITRPETPHASASPAASVRVEPGTHADARALERYHYLGGKPATVCRVLRAARPTAFGELLAGVLVVSMPTFNGVWRRQAWPGRYEGCCKRAAAARMNDELRCISRVIVEPRSRGLGVASALVRAYLRDPLSPATEAVAAMGGVSPFFRAAGMTEYHLPRPLHDARLSDALAHEGLNAFDVLDAGVRARPFVAHELRRWAKNARVRINQADPLPAIARHAVCRLASRPRAYAAGGHHGGDERERATHTGRADRSK